MGFGRSAREQTNDLHGAKALYSKATELDPKNDAAQVLFIGIAVYFEHPLLLAAMQANLARVLRALGDVGGAMNMLTKAASPPHARATAHNAVTNRV